MNKHRKAESRRVKSYVRVLRSFGSDISYKKARRNIRKRDRATRDIPRNLRRGFVRGANRINRSMAETVAGFAKLASSLLRTSMFPLRATALMIDEMAFYDDTRPQWPKENPHLAKEVVPMTEITNLALYLAEKYGIAVNRDEAVYADET